MKKYLVLGSSIILIIAMLSSAYPGRAEGIIGTPPANPADGGPILQYSGCGGKTVSASNADYEQQVIDLVNQELVNNGTVPSTTAVAELRGGRPLEPEESTASPARSSRRR